MSKKFIHELAVLNDTQAGDKLIISRAEQEYQQRRDKFLLSGQGLYVKSTVDFTIGETFQTLRAGTIQVVYDDWGAYVTAGAEPELEGTPGPSQSIVVPYAGSYLVEMMADVLSAAFDNYIQFAIWDDEGAKIATTSQAMIVLSVGVPFAERQCLSFSTVLRLAAGDRIHYGMQLYTEKTVKPGSFLKIHFLG